MPAALLAIALPALLAALALPLVAEIPPGARAHLAFACGVMPLILAAIGYFVPVLSRSQPAPAAARALPWVAFAAGALAFAWFLDAAAIPHGHALAASIAGGATLAFAAWIASRARAAIGAAHPGIAWYLAAVACLALALAAVVAMPVWPEHHAALKNFHLHLNTGGFIGITALGTLQVLMPTATGRADAGAAARLRADLPFALAAALAVATGAALNAWLAAVGALLWSVPVTRMARAWGALHAAQIASWHGAAPPLAAALCGFALCIAHGAAHALGAVTPTPSVASFIALFLLPLITGAAAQLLPTWVRPGSQRDWHAQARRSLGRWSGARALAFLCAGAGIAFDAAFGAPLAALVLAAFIAQALVALSPRRRTTMGSP